MKVLMLAPGSWIHSQRSLNLLLSNNCDVAFVDYEDPKPEGADRYQFVPYPRSRGERLRPLIGQQLSDRLILSTAAFGLRRIWRRFCPDVVHLFWPDERAYQCARAGLKPLVITVLGSEINRTLLPTADPAYRSRLGEALRAADLVIADAPDMLECCPAIAGRRIPMELLTLGVDTKTFRPGYHDAALGWRERMAVPREAKVLLSVRAFEHRYGHQLILEAFARALPQLKSQAFLVFKIYNHDPRADYEGELRLQAERLDVTSFIRWLKHVSFGQMPELYSAADIIVNYPRMDAFPVSFLEAGACERPVITARLRSYLGTFAERHFYLVEPDDVSGLADTIVKVLNGDLRQSEELARELRQTIEKEHDETVIAARLLNLYKRIARN